jgi:hypothetical protein
MRSGIAGRGVYNHRHPPLWDTRPESESSPQIWSFLWHEKFPANLSTLRPLCYFCSMLDVLYIKSKRFYRMNWHSSHYCLSQLNWTFLHTFKWDINLLTSLLFFKKIVMLGGGYIVAFTKVLTMHQINHTWIHQFTALFHPPSPDSWNSSNRCHFFIYIHVYTLFALHYFLQNV